MLKLFNTETRNVVPFSPAKPGVVLLYTCGPTVYNYAHIGNFRTYVFEDLLRRTLIYFGIEVDQAMNITDVEDKTIKGSIESGKSLAEFTEFYTRAFFDDLEALNIQRVEHYPKATDFIPKMIEMIQTLLDKGIAYVGADKSVYFSIKHFPNYGRLSHLKLDELQEGASERVAADEYDKESASDFVLWKAYDETRDGPIFWESPFGKGRPGWHIECSAMATAILGDTIDIHVGGVDNIFPHHENEIAQSEGCTGCTFVRHWIHAEHLLVNNKKMSKSLGNFYTLRDLMNDGYTGPEVRLMLLSAHYRTQLNFTLEGLKSARASLTRLSDFVDRLKKAQGPSGHSIDPIINETRTAFSNALADDLNISTALAALFDFVRKGNSLADRGKLGQEGAEKALSFLNELDSVLGIIPLETQELDIPQNLLEALQKREAARKEKNWAVADEMRDLITASGYVIEDTPEGARLKLQ